MLTGLALTAVFWLNVVAYTTTNTPSLLGLIPDREHRVTRTGRRRASR